MKILRTVAELRAWRRGLPAGETVGFVPTMGALHEGHLSLVALSRAQTTRTVMSIFVNPTQFGPKEDFSRYPRPVEQDLELAGTAKVDAVFLPEVAEIYPAGASTFVVEEEVSLPLCGEFRPGHFRGVATVVLKLFNLVEPTRAYFGQKDAQQLAVIERMVRDLHVPVVIVRGETLRERDGLAMSSRNRYLSADDRERAALIFRSLKAAADLFAAGERDVTRLTQAGRSILEAESAFRIQYWEIRNLASLQSIDVVPESGALIAVAAYLGPDSQPTRLIDNWILKD